MLQIVLFHTTLQSIQTNKATSLWLFKGPVSLGMKTLKFEPRLILLPDERICVSLITFAVNMHFMQKNH